MGDENALFGIGVSSGMISILVLLLYTGSEEVKIHFTAPIILIFLVPVLLFWLSRVWMLGFRGEIDNDPVEFTIKDKSTYFIAIIVLIVFVTSKYAGLYV